MLPTGKQGSRVTLRSLPWSFTFGKRNSLQPEPLHRTYMPQQVSAARLFAAKSFCPETVPPVSDTYRLRPLPVARVVSSQIHLGGAMPPNGQSLTPNRAPGRNPVTTEPVRHPHTWHVISSGRSSHLSYEQYLQRKMMPAATNARMPSGNTQSFIMRSILS